MIIFYVFATSYLSGTQSTTNDPAVFAAENALAAQTIQTAYPMFQDINVMVFIGFGFIMVFLKTASWTAVGFNFIISCWAI